MSGITGIGTTFNLPNYHGELFALSPAETPLLSSIGGLTGGGQVTSSEFEWQTYDLRTPAQVGRVRVEGDTAPTAEERVRSNVRNVVQIHQEKVSLSYTKQSTPGQVATPSSAPYREAAGGANPIGNELDWQVQQAVKSIALDVNWSFINGQFANPSTNSTARQTRGLLAALTSNRVSQAVISLTGATSATDTVTSTAHGLSNGDQIVFTNTGVATGIIAGRLYYVVSTATNTFKVAATVGGSAITLGTATGLDVHSTAAADVTVANIGSFVQGVFDNGGLSGTPIFLVNSAQKRKITNAYAVAYGQTAGLVQPGERLGGVSVDRVLTDFGEFGIMLDRHMPQDAIAAVTLSQLRPIFLSVPGKGVFFEEPLAKTGASDDVQIYGEIGLEYGSELNHGLLYGLKS